MLCAHLTEELHGERIGGGVVRVVPEQGARHEPHRVQLPILLLDAL